MPLHRKMLCGVVHRDSEHRIVSATILIHAACGHGLTQGTAPEYPEERNLRLEDKKNEQRKIRKIRAECPDYCPIE